MVVGVVVVVVDAVVVVVDAVVVVVVVPVPGFTTKNDVVDAESPSESVTVSVADWLPALKVLSTYSPVAVLPSAKSQL